MKDIQAATMAMATPSSQESPFKVKIDVKDLEKVQSIITGGKYRYMFAGLGCDRGPRAAEGAERGEVAGEDGPAQDEQHQESSHVQPPTHRYQEAEQPQDNSEERHGVASEESCGVQCRWG